MWEIASVYSEKWRKIGKLSRTPIFLSMRSLVFASILINSSPNKLIECYNIQVLSLSTVSYILHTAMALTSGVVREEFQYPDFHN